MGRSHPIYRGIWLPLVSPFKDGVLDQASLRRLVRAYCSKVDGFVLGATTGEGLTLSAEEIRLTLQWTAEELETARTPTPILLGITESNTAAAMEKVHTAENLPVDGYLVACPPYVRPSQEGLRLHFEAVAAGTDKDLVIYNIPYRTGVNLQNDTLFELAQRPNIAGVKDCCADPAQTHDLLARKPAGFSVFAGDDATLCAALTAGADGGITASAHIRPDLFRRMTRLATEGSWRELDTVWTRLAALADLLFSEPNPASLKHCLWRMGLIESPELRLPMTGVSAQLALRLDELLSATPASM